MCLSGDLRCPLFVYLFSLEASASLFSVCRRRYLKSARLLSQCLLPGAEEGKKRAHLDALSTLKEAVSHSCPPNQFFAGPLAQTQLAAVLHLLGTHVVAIGEEADKKVRYTLFTTFRINFSLVAPLDARRC